MIARIVVDGGAAAAFVPYGLRDIPKSFPGKRWNSDDKCWIVGSFVVDELADALRAAGCTVYITGRDGTAWTSGRPNTGHRDTPAKNWAEALLDAVGEQRADRVCRLLAKVLHPDAGGSTQLMQELNNARDRLGARR